MSQFFKFFTASCLGVFAAIAIIGLIFAGFLGSMAGNKPIVPKNTVLELDFSSFVPEKTGNVESSAMSFEQVDKLGLNSIVALLDYAATDDKVKGLLIKGGGVNAGQATVSSIREALVKFKKSEKFVYSYADFYSQSGYFLGSVADSVFLNPNGMVDIKGFATMVPFFKNALDNVGIKMNVFYAGNFKSATEPFRRTEMSEPSKIQTREFLTSLVDQYKDLVSSSRNMSSDELDEIMTNYKGRDAKSSLESGLIDKIVYWDEVESTMRRELDIKADKKIKLKSLTDYYSAVTLPKESKAKAKIAIVYAEGTISYGTDAKGSISEAKYLKIFEKIKNDDDIKAMVLRVNSGGGSSITSDILWRAIENVKAAGKPVVASFGDYAASGGYYIAAGADTIVSAPNCLTGSIGVFMMFPNMTGLMNDKLGVNFDEVKTHPMAVGLSPVKDLTDAEKELLQKGTDDIYEQFLNRVAEGRGMTRDEVHEVAQGRVWTGTKALEIGLVDVIGGIDDAVKLASEMAGVEDFKTKEYPFIKETFLDQVVKGISETNNVQAALGINIDKSDLEMVRQYREVKNLLLDRTPQARLPFILKVD
ncbi:MAG: protease-4 [Saprospiraceae bacterium]|jgi:protease-4